MSPSNSDIRRAGAARAGFTLAELLVAMVIFLTLMGGVAALYAGAARTVQQGQRAIQNFETARALMSALDQDLKAAFTARQYGQYFQFFGRPEGFMFVGQLANGQLGRVTYVTNPNVNTKTFETSVYERWDFVKQRMERQTRAWAQRYNLDADAAWATVEAAFLASYPPPATPDSLVEFSVTITTQSLLRYVEPGVNDLNTFDLSKIRQAVNSAMNWPIFDPDNPYYDQPDGDGDAIANDGIAGTLYAQMLAAINPQAPLNISSATDMRNLLLQAQVDAAQNQQFLYVMRPQFITVLLQAKQREIWLRLLADDTSMGLPSFWKDPQNPGDLRPDRRDYVIADDILARGRLRTADGTTWIDLLLPENDGYSRPRLILDMYDVPQVFTYANAKSDFTEFFNTLERIPGYADFMALGAPDVADFKAFDDVLANYFAGERASATETGSPLTPRLPALVQPGFWVVTEKPTVNAADFRRWFTQLVEIPAGAGRDLPAAFVPNLDDQA